MVNYHNRSPAGMYTVPLLFNIILELVLRLAIQDQQIGARVQGQYINNLYGHPKTSRILAENEEDL